TRRDASPVAPDDEGATAGATPPEVAGAPQQVSVEREAPTAAPKVSVHEPSGTRAEGPPPSRMDHDDHQGPEVAPVVRVSIGRIDVRAVAPQAPPVRAAPARPSSRLSLNDYLRQHNKGTR